MSPYVFAKCNYAKIENSKVETYEDYCMKFIFEFNIFWHSDTSFYREVFSNAPFFITAEDAGALTARSA